MHYVLIEDDRSKIKTEKNSVLALRIMAIFMLCFSIVAIAFTLFDAMWQVYGLPSQLFGYILQGSFGVFCLLVSIFGIISVDSDEFPLGKLLVSLLFISGLIIAGAILVWCVACAGI
jgi:hypothetical protein